MSRYEEVLHNIVHKSVPPYPTSAPHLEEALDSFLVEKRISTKGYPPSEALFYDIEEWEQVHPGEDFEMWFRESLADAT